MEASAGHLRRPRRQPPRSPDPRVPQRPLTRWPIARDGFPASSKTGLTKTVTGPGLAGYLVYSVSHLAFHATHLGGLPPQRLGLRRGITSAAAGTAAVGRPDAGVSGTPSAPHHRG